MDPLVSVTMTTYNHAPYIAEAIEGVIRQQTDFPIELVIGEDCSTDSTREIVFDYEEKYPEIIRVITSEKNVGVKANSRRIEKAAKGKYIAFCEGDDFWHNPMKLQEQVDYLENNPNCRMVTADCNVYFDGTGEVLKDYSQNQGYRDIQEVTIEEILKKRLLWTCTVVIEKALLEKIVAGDPYLFHNEKFLMGDTQTWAEASVLTDVIYLPRTLATYRKLDESLSSSMDLMKNILFSKSASELRLYLNDKHQVSAALRDEEELHWCDVALRLAFHSRDPEMADEVKAKKEVFNWREHLRYLGCRNRLIHYCYRAGRSVVVLFRRQKSFWGQ